jgi:hypothetical protein
MEAAFVSVIPLPRVTGTVPLVLAVDRFLDRFRDDPGTDQLRRDLDPAPRGRPSPTE